MDEITACPICHMTIRPTDFFCFSCGKNLHPAPPSTSISTQVQLFVGSILLPPMGIIWGLRYLKSADQKSRTIGIMLIGVTVVLLIVATKLAINMYNAAMSQVNQIQNLQGF